MGTNRLWNKLKKNVTKKFGLNISKQNKTHNKTHKKQSGSMNQTKAINH